MLQALKFKHVGPADALSIDLKPRMNFLAGDNGLGKSFLLDVAWWVLTQTWARGLVVPHPPPADPAIEYRYSNHHDPDPVVFTSRFNRDVETWRQDASLFPPNPGLVLYAQVDGGFSVWDPARSTPGRPYIFTPEEVWEGTPLCEGLYRDWASWQREGGVAFDALCRVLDALSPSPTEKLVPGELRKISLDDPKRYPTLRMPYGHDVPVVHASAGHASHHRAGVLARVDLAGALGGKRPPRQAVVRRDHLLDRRGRSASRQSTR